MKTRITLTSLILSVILHCNLSAQETISVFDKVLFYDGYNTLEKLADEMVPVPEDCLRLKTSLYTKKLTASQLSSFGKSIVMNVEIKAACDNYDRIGNVNLAFVPKGAETYSPEEVERIELGRFITPFMNKNKQPDTVPYSFEVDYLSHIFRDENLLNEYDFWLELEVFGVPYAANTQVAGCAGRNDVFYGSLEFVTSVPPADIQNNRVLIPLFINAPFNNYKENATDEIGKTIRSTTFTLDKTLTDAQFVLITSNHGANSGGEEYNRRMHYVYFDDMEVLNYKPGRTSCEPFRQYNTQSNGIYGTYPKTDESWQSFSNWCPGDIIDNRVIQLGAVNEGNHTFRIEVPEAKFVNKEGNFPLSLYLLGKTEGTVGISNEKHGVDFVQIYPNPVKSSFIVNSNSTVTSIDIYDLKGQLIYSGNDSLTDLSDKPTGIYTARIKFSDGRISQQKIIKQ